MSAIFGIINKDGRPVDPEMVQKMKQAMQHRAKDGSRELLAGNAAFGFCHLVVYPNQEHEKLPVEDGDLLFAAEAHLHNRDELVNKLGFHPGRVETTPDSILILEAYKKWGGNCVHHLDGEYVYVIWNKVSQQLFISNDHIGYKALYYWDTPGQFVFCSEIKGIEAIKSTTNYFDANSLIYHGFRQGDPEATYNKEIKSLCGGYTLTIKDREVSKRKYWQLQPGGKHSYRSNAEWYDALRSLLWKAVEVRLNPDKPVGITLSGGLDSSSVACMLSAMLKKKNKPLYAFSSVPIDKDKYYERDERSYIQLVNDHCGNIIQCNVAAEGKGPFKDVIETFMTDETIPNYFHYMDTALLQSAEERNIAITYSGFGGDFWVSAKGHQVINLLFKDRRWSKGLQLIKQLAKNEQSSILKAAYRHYVVFTPLYLALKKFKPEWRTKNYWKKHLFTDYPTENIVSIIPYISEMINRGTISADMGRFDKRHQRYGMLSANPFFDRNLMEYMVEVPAELFLEGGHQRSLLRHAMEGILPGELQWRTTKAPYVIDHFERFDMYNEPLIGDFINSGEYSFLFDHLYTKEGIQKLMSRIRNTRRKDLKRILAYEISYLGVSGITLKYLKEKKYMFAEN